MRFTCMTFKSYMTNLTFTFSIKWSGPAYLLGVYLQMYAANVSAYILLGYAIVVTIHTLKRLNFVFQVNKFLKLWFPRSNSVTVVFETVRTLKSNLKLQTVAKTTATTTANTKYNEQKILCAAWLSIFIAMNCQLWI